jgi:hypothetical protein
MIMFKKKTKYRAMCLIMTPNGLVKEGTILTGKEWEELLVFEVGENSFDSMFKVVKAKASK